MYQLQQEQEVQEPPYINQQPIIVIQDFTSGNISTTDDILNQLDLFIYSTQLKGVNLNQFMQMTDEKDFKLYGIQKQKDCHRLCQCAQSIRRTSLCSSSSYYDIPSPSSADLKDDFVSSLASIAIVDDGRKDMISEESIQQTWPNSNISLALDEPPSYAQNYRRYSLPTPAPTLPEYCDSILDERRRHSDGMLHKDPREGKELLPKYSCSVQKMGQAKAKIEFETPGVRPRFRPWRDVHLELQGTMLKIFEMKHLTPTAGGYRSLPALAPYYTRSYKYIKLYNISLANAQVGVAMDYVKRPNVFRITTEKGPQMLVQVQTNACVSSWIEKLLSGCNIAVDLEHQRMPKFDSVQIEPFAGWNSTTRLLYQEYATEEILRRDTDSTDALI